MTHDPVQHAVNVATVCARVFDLNGVDIVVALPRPDHVLFLVAQGEAHPVAIDDAEWIARRVVEIRRDGIIANRPGFM